MMTSFTSQRREIVLLNCWHDNLTDDVIGDGNIFQQDLNNISKGNQNLKESKEVQ